jgi:mono/diheme cytochrome c family protein
VAAARLGVIAIATVLSAALLTASKAATTQQGDQRAAVNTVTFAKDVAPIFQAACQDCHRPGTAAPMSLLTFNEVRPWAKSIRARVVRREMPPWSIDRNVGIDKFKNDRSLTDEQIATIAAWVDNGALLGDPRDLPPPKQFDDPDKWQIGTPDLIVSMPLEHVVPASGPDWFGTFTVGTGLTEARYIKAIEIRPSKTAIKAVHHINLGVVQEPTPTGLLHSHEPGGNPDVYPDGYGFLLQPGSQFRFNIHYHSYGEETVDRSSVGIVFYPTGQAPKHEVLVEVFRAGFESGDLLPPRGFRVGRPLDLDIPAGDQHARHDGYHALPKPVRIMAFQPHMHERGKALCLEAILPTGKIELLNCVDRYDFRWQMHYRYADDVAPLLPAGTIMHVITWHDNSRTPLNPDPKNWIGWGQRSIDEMAEAIMKTVQLTEAEFRAQISERARATRSTNAQ